MNIDFIVGNEEPLTTLIGKYINNKVWYNDFCNIVPLAISNAFSIKIVMLTPDRIPTFYEIIRRNNEVDSPYIMHLRHNHYSGTTTPATIKPRASSSSSSSSVAVMPRTSISRHQLSTHQLQSPTCVKNHKLACYIVRAIFIVSIRFTSYIVCGV